MKKQTMKDKVTKLVDEKYLPKNVENMEEELVNILPPGEAGAIFVSVQFGGTSLTIPVPDVAKDVLGKLKIKNRTIFNLRGFKIGLDII